ncbi:hypothetical protein GN958_ATG22129 [Phytophthora infestans]|uniref:Uncharacterized protein n=1 Tax=Phytophthora infestans TaxID=4787 RepID=A0A8S9TP75_PHYIN|nr:hypothetical protein GN958_ATG22129 [Phytophthora infestans]
MDAVDDTIASAKTPAATAIVQTDIVAVNTTLTTGNNRDSAIICETTLPLHFYIVSKFNF